MNAWNQYHSPKSVAEALSLLDRLGPDARIVAGGTDLILDLEFGREEKAEALVDVTAIMGLDRIEFLDGHLEIGAAATHAVLSTHPLVTEHARALAESCGVVGGPQVRNVATIGGNIAHALPAADGTTSLIALDAEVQIHTFADGGVVSDWRPLIGIFSGPGKNVLSSNQMIGAVRIPGILPRSASGFERIMRPQGVALPMLGVALSLTLDKTLSRIEKAALAIGPAGPVPFRAIDAETVLIGGPLNRSLIASAVAAARSGVSLRTSRHRASREYRHEMIDVLIFRVLEKTLERAGGKGVENG